MQLFGRTFFEKPTPQPTTQVVQVKPIGANVSTFSINDGFSIQADYLQKTSKGYLFGPDGLFPQELNKLSHSSPLHSSILHFKRLLTVGNGYSFDVNVDGIKKVSINQLTNQFDYIMAETAMDLFIHGRVCLKLTWNTDNTKVLKVERISPEKIHINELNDEMEPINFLYNWDWTHTNKYTTKKYPIFDQMNKTDKVQLYFYQTTSAGQKLYSEPSYESAIPWIVLDMEMAQYHKANILNSVNPSLLIQYYEKPGSKEEKQAVLSDLNNSFAGARKTGRSMITFSDGKELSPTVTQMEPNKLDKTFLQLTSVINYQISYAHQIDPTLLGLAKPANLGDSNDIAQSYAIFNAAIIKPAQLELEAIYNTFLGINGLGVKTKFNDSDIFNNLVKPK